MLLHTDSLDESRRSLWVGVSCSISLNDRDVSRWWRDLTASWYDFCTLLLTEGGSGGLLSKSRLGRTLPSVSRYLGFVGLIFLITGLCPC